MHLCLVVLRKVPGHLPRIRFRLTVGTECKQRGDDFGIGIQGCCVMQRCQPRLSGGSLPRMLHSLAMSCLNLIIGSASLPGHGVNSGCHLVADVAWQTPDFVTMCRTLCDSFLVPPAKTVSWRWKTARNGPLNRPESGQTGEKHRFVVAIREPLPKHISSLAPANAC